MADHTGIDKVARSAHVWRVVERLSWIVTVAAGLVWAYDRTNVGGTAMTEWLALAPPLAFLALTAALWVARLRLHADIRFLAQKIIDHRHRP